MTKTKIDVASIRSALNLIEDEDLGYLPGIAAAAIAQIAASIGHNHEVEWKQLFAALDRSLDDDGNLEEAKAQFADWVNS